MGKGKNPLPVIMGMNPPTKEVIILKAEEPLNGYACFINYAKFPDGTTTGQRLSRNDVVERAGNACWLHFTNVNAMKMFGQFLVDFADGNPDKELA